MAKPINDKIAKLHSDVFYFALSRVDDYQEAEDIAQTVMEKALNKAHTLRNEAKLKSWVMKIASNEINTYFRKVKKINSILFNIDEMLGSAENIDSQIVDLEKDILQNMTQKCDKANICKAMDNLDDKYQIVLQLCIVCEYDFLQVSRILNVNINSVKTKYYRGLKILKKEFLRIETGGGEIETKK